MNRRKEERMYNENNWKSEQRREGQWDIMNKREGCGLIWVYDQ